MEKLNLATATLHYKITQKASPLKGTIVFLHGIGLDHTEWNYLLPYFEGYQILTYDLRWHGRSTGEFHAMDEENWQALINDFQALLEEEEIESFHIVSHGIGAQLAVELISRNVISPHTFTCLSTPFYYPANVAKEGIKYRTEKIKEMTGRELGTWMIPQIMVNEDSEKHELVKNAYEKVNMDIYMDIFLLHANAVSLEKLTKINVPTLILNGELDVNYPPALTNLSTNYLSNAHVKVIRNASNMVHVDQPKATAAYIIDFINPQLAKIHKQTSDLPYLSMLYQELENSNPLLIRIDFLTVFSMKVNEKSVKGKWNQRKARELISYLAFFGKSSKEKVYEALWPSATKDRAQNSLRVSIHHIRSLLKEANMEDILCTDTQYVWLNENMEIKCDVKEAINGTRDIPPLNSMFSDMPVDWIMDIQYELEEIQGAGLSR